MSQAVSNALYAASQYALVAVALTLTYSIARFLNFALGATFAIAAYATYWFMQAGLPAITGAFAGIIAAAIIGIIFETAVFDRLLKYDTTPLVALIASLGILVLVQGTLSLCFGTEVKILRPSNVVAGLDILGARLTIIQVFAIVSGFSLCGATWLWLQHSNFGRQFRAVACDMTLAKAVGLNVDGIILRTTILSSILVSFAGVIAAHDVDLRPMMGFPPLLMGAVAMLAGGVGNVIGACLAALLLGALQEFTVVILPTQWQQAIVFVILVAVLFLPAVNSFEKEPSPENP